MRRFFTPFFLTLSAIVVLGYAYLAWRLAGGTVGRLLLAVPCLLVWLVPMAYWAGGRESTRRADELLHAASYFSMGWLNFLLLFALLRDGLLGLAWLAGAEKARELLATTGTPLVFAASLAALAVGALAALRGPAVQRVSIPVAGLDAALEGFKIVQISDLHVGPTIGRRYVSRVVERANALAPDLTVLTGDIVDGAPQRLAPHVAPLGGLRARHGSVFILGNHDCYSGARRWIAQFRGLGMRVLLNEALVLEHGGARLIVGGVVDPALRLSEPDQQPRADLAAAPQAGAGLRILLAHNPALAELGERAGFDVQLSGHTHAGQFFPWTLAVRAVHAPHVAGLSRQGKMWVYVCPGTGSWGPPVRFGTRTELTLLELRRSDGAAAPTAGRAQ
ncbi:metallophosphoesterase [Azohydromonas lata]|uniref:Metallophosphoesterase n=1 Tax=Azohydromonas lata TaxID=45677 RepID=A0ABU5IG67_9BURK|nr:metallophosphoesterase [Azohydromonas lata]MDZ5457520.1 metallophosphoesterase [Azohydromonas lata]